MKGGIASVMGLILGDQILLWLTVAGVAALLQTYPHLFMAMQWVGAAYLSWLGVRMVFARPGEGPSIKITPGKYFKETMFITLLNPKAIMFYFAFFPQFIDPDLHQGLITFVFMATTIAALGFAYCFGVVVITHTMAERIRASPTASGVLQKVAGLFLIVFGLKLALGK